MMRRLAHLFIGTLALLNLGVAQAQGGADLAIEVLDSGAPVIQRGGIVAQYQMKSITQTRPLELTYVARNVGPVRANAAIAVSFNNRPGSVEVSASDCPSTVSTDVAPGRNVQFDVGPLGPGASRSCRVTLRALPTAPRTYVAIQGSVRAVGARDVFGNNNITAELFYGLSPSDIEQDWVLEVRGPVGHFPPGSSSTVDIVLTNRGPGVDPAPSVQIVLSDQFNFGGVAAPSERVEYYSTADPDCSVSADAIHGGNGGSAGLQIDFQAIPVLSSRTCTLRIVALPGAAGMGVLRFTATNTTPGGFDPNLANNTALLTLQFSAMAVPVVSPPGAFFLLLGLWLIALMRQSTALGKT